MSQGNTRSWANGLPAYAGTQRNPPPVRLLVQLGDPSRLVQLYPREEKHGLVYSNQVWANATSRQVQGQRTSIEGNTAHHTGRRTQGESLRGNLVSCWTTATRTERKDSHGNGIDGASNGFIYGRKGQTLRRQSDRSGRMGMLRLPFMGQNLPQQRRRTTNILPAMRGYPRVLHAEATEASRANQSCLATAYGKDSKASASVSRIWRNIPTARNVVNSLATATSTVLTVTGHSIASNHSDRPNIQNDTPFFVCPFCGTNLLNRSWHWLQFDARKHMVRECSKTKPGSLSLFAPLDNGANVSTRDSNGSPNKAVFSSTTHNSLERGVMDHEYRKILPIRDYKGQGI